MNADLTIIYEWSADGWWVAEIAEVPGALAQGRTKEEARSNIIGALKGLLEARRSRALQHVCEPSQIETLKLAS